MGLIPVYIVTHCINTNMTKCIILYIIQYTLHIIRPLYVIQYVIYHSLYHIYMASLATAIKYRETNYIFSTHMRQFIMNSIL